MTTVFICCPVKPWEFFYGPYLSKQVETYSQLCTLHHIFWNANLAYFDRKRRNQRQNKYKTWVNRSDIKSIRKTILYYDLDYSPWLAWTCNFILITIQLTKLTSIKKKPNKQMRLHLCNLRTHRVLIKSLSDNTEWRKLNVVQTPSLSTLSPTLHHTNSCL